MLEVLKSKYCPVFRSDKYFTVFHKLYKNVTTINTIFYFQSISNPWQFNSYFEFLSSTAASFDIQAYLTFLELRWIFKSSDSCQTMPASFNNDVFGSCIDTFAKEEHPTLHVYRVSHNFPYSSVSILDKWAMNTKRWKLVFNCKFCLSTS